LKGEHPGPSSGRRLYRSNQARTPPTCRYCSRPNSSSISCA